MQAVKKFSHPSEPAQEFNLTLLIRQIHFRRDIGNGAKLVASHLLMACGRRGYCSLPIKSLAWELDMRLTQLHVYVRELVQVGYLERQAHPGRANTWIIPEVRAMQPTPSVHRRTIFKSFKKENVTDPKPQENVIPIFSDEQPPDPPPPSNSPQPDNDIKSPSESHSKPKKPIRMDIVRALVQETGDKRSFGFWCLVSRDISLDDIRYCVESLRIAVNDNTVRNKGRYLTAILKSRCPEAFQEKQAPRPSQEQKPAPMPRKEAPPDYTNNLEQIRKLRAMLEARP